MRNWNTFVINNAVFDWPENPGGQVQAYRGDGDWVLHVPLFRHGLLAQALYNTSQVSPTYWGGHVHVKLLGRSWHVPPFAHGFDGKQSFISISHDWPKIAIKKLFLSLSYSWKCSKINEFVSFLDKSDKNFITYINC
jgi:hypothetical protein